MRAEVRTFMCAGKDSTITLVFYFMSLTLVKHSKFSSRGKTDTFSCCSKAWTSFSFRATTYMNCFMCSLGTKKWTPFGVSFLYCASQAWLSELYMYSLYIKECIEKLEEIVNRTYAHNAILVPILP